MSGDFRTRVRDYHQSMTPSERNLVSFLIEYPGEIALMSASELARKLGVSKSTVSRLFAKLGYDKYDSARKEVADARRAGILPYLHSANVSDILDRTLSDHIAVEINNIVQSYHRIDYNTIKRCVDLINSSRNIFILGFRSNHSLATYMHRYLKQIRDDVALVPNVDHSIGECLHMMDGDDLIIYFALRRRSHLHKSIMKLFQLRNVKVIYFYDASDLTEVEDNISFRCDVVGSGLFDSYVFPISIINLICTEVGRTVSESIAERIDRIEATNALLGEIDS